MTQPTTRAILAIIVLSLSAVALAAPRASRRADGPPLAHMVFFTLKERTPEARKRFAEQCQRFLDGHDGVRYFSVGIIAEDVEEPVSVRDFDVALHVVFDGKDSKAKYLKHPRHDEFVQRNKDVWSQVRVFDSYLNPGR
jgi:hypothetical protein